jgi:D-arabinose 1-dehydrogenase-like Zn-dependent alcohol dehydrogenase
VKIPGVSYDGGYQQYMVAPVTALATIPESLDSIEAAPLLCAGITTYNSLRHAGRFEVGTVSNTTAACVNYIQQLLYHAHIAARPQQKSDWVWTMR